MVLITKDSLAQAHGLIPEGKNEDAYLEYVQSQKNAPRTVTAKYFLAADEKMLRIQEVVDQIANANVPVLITGESGVGKEIIAKAIHAASMRKDMSFVAVNCAAIPSALLEGELFGHEKGAFTGAVQRHIGKFEQASGGTLLLDEITEMELPLQAKLLRVLQEKEIERVGGNGPISVDTRIIATTNRSIHQMVQQGGFRQDLFFRLHVINIDVPPLRQRTRDIELLANHFLAKFSEQFAKPALTFGPDALKALNEYSWPGNVRELQNIVQRAVLLTSGMIISASDLPFDASANGSGERAWIDALPIGRQLRDVETHFILETLKHHQGNRTHAAKALGISLRTLRNKINEFTSEGLEVMAPLTGKAI